MGTVCNSPCFWCSVILNSATHYTMLFDICQMLNEINRGYLPQKGTKSTRGIMNVELRNVEFRTGDGENSEARIQETEGDFIFCG